MEIEVFKGLSVSGPPTRVSCVSPHLGAENKLLQFVPDPAINASPQMVKLRRAAHRFRGLISSPPAALSSLAATPRLGDSTLRPVHGIWRRRPRLLPACLAHAVWGRDCNSWRPDAG